MFFFIATVGPNPRQIDCRPVSLSFRSRFCNNSMQHIQNLIYKCWGRDSLFTNIPLCVCVRQRERDKSWALFTAFFFFVNFLFLILVSTCKSLWHFSGEETLLLLVWLIKFPEYSLSYIIFKKNLLKYHFFHFFIWLLHYFLSLFLI